MSIKKRNNESGVNESNLINKIVATFSDNEDIYYKESLQISTLFQHTDGAKINIVGNTSALYNTSLNLIKKYTSSPIRKTYYMYSKTASSDYKQIIDSLNWNLSEEHRPKLMIIKNILQCRYNNQNPFVTEVSNYDQYGIQSESSLICPNCNSHKITIENKQKRSADEPSETFYKCQDCSREFKEHYTSKLLH
jgi:DNA-directed RNA polymerase subunit M/transcription elongation factor TFIIS